MNWCSRRRRCDGLPRATAAARRALLAVAFALPGVAHAAPSAEIAYEITNADGSRFAAVTKGDEWNNWVESAAGFTVGRAANGNWYYVREHRGGKAVLDRTPAKDAPPKGLSKHLHSDADVEQRAASLLSAGPIASLQGKVLFILAEFSNFAGTTSESSWAKYTGTLIPQYYAAASNGAVTLTPAAESFGTANNGVVGWLNLGYAHPDTGSQWVAANRTLTHDAIVAADPYVNFAEFDENHDGTVEGDELAVVVVAAGYEAAASSTYRPSLWAHSGNLESAVVVDGVSVGRSHNGGYGYAQLGEIHRFSELDAHRATLGVPVHELGHLIFRLPDLYVSMYDVMSAGLWGARNADAYIGMTPVLPSAWTKSTLLWATAIEADGIQPVVTAAGSPGGSDTIRKISTPVATQYFLVENRRNVGYDQGLQWYLGSNFRGGVAIWHIDETVQYGDDSHRKVDLEEADGTADGGNTDLWYVGNRTTFNDTSVPNSRLYDGSSTYESIDVLTPPLFSMSILASDADTCSAPGSEGKACSNGLACDGLETCSNGTCSIHADNRCAEGPVCGDGNGDGKVTASDALDALRVAVGSGSCPDGACDYNGNGEVTTSDAQAILRVAVGEEIAPNCPAALQGFVTTIEPTSMRRED